MFSRTGIIILLIFSVFVAFGQRPDKPQIRAYTSKQFKAHAQNWCVATDSNGILYFGNQEGVLEFDGYQWRTVTIPNKSTVRSLATDTSGTLYIGAVAEFGFLHPNEQGTLIYKSLCQLVDTAYLHFADVWNVVIHNGLVWFLTDKYLFCYNGQTIKTYLPQGQYFYAMFVVNNHLFVQDYGLGLKQFKHDAFYGVKGGEAYANSGLHALMEVNGKLLAGTRNTGLFLFDTLSGISRPLNPALNQQLETYSLYHGIKLNQGNIGIATIGKGVWVIDTTGQIIEQFLKEDGLSSPNVYHMAVLHNQLWLACENGISVVDYHTPMRLYTEAMGISGNINDIVLFDQQLYYASGTGVYRLAKNGRFEVINGIRGQGWDFEILTLPNGKKALLCGASEGLFRIEQNRATLVQKSSSVFRVHASSALPSSVYIALGNTLSVLRFNENFAIAANTKLKTFKYEVREILEEGDSILWVGVTYEGLHKLQIPQYNKAGNTPTTLFNQQNGFNFGRYVIAFRINNQTVFSTESGLYTFDAKQHAFRDFTLGSYANTNGAADELLYINQYQNEYWMNNRYHFIQQNNQVVTDTVKIRFLNDIQAYHQFIDDNGTYYIGTEGNIYTLSQNNNGFKLYPLRALVRSVSIGPDSLLFNGHGRLSPEPLIKYRSGPVKFTFCATDHLFAEQLQFSYKLEGFDKTWSDWTTDNRKEFTNLFEGKYTLLLRAKNAFGVISPVTQYQFTVKPPPYRSFWAMGGYLIGLIVLVYFIIHWRTLKLSRDRDRLNQIVDERTAEVISQKEEIEASAENLRLVNQELQKLSVIAQKTDNAVAIFDNSGNVEWVNTGFTRLYGYTLDEFVKLRGRNILANSLNPNIKEAMQRCIDTRETTIYEFFSITKTMKGVWAQTTLTPIMDEQGQLHKMIAIDSDITKLKEAEQKIEFQRDELKKANDTKDKFFSIIAHDLRGPLSNIFTLLNILINDIDNLSLERIKKSIILIRENTGNTFNLTENLLEWAHLRKNTIVCTPKTLVMAHLIAENIELFQGQATKKNITLLQNSSSDIIAFADTEMIKTVLRNLLSNAIKFTPDNGKVVITAEYRQSFVCIDVSDTGIGIDKESLSTLFNLDKRHSTPGTHNEKGSGLGLILAKEFVERNGGNLTVKSVINQGSTFTITLPKPR